jgi:hypothetical protein
VAVQRGQVGVDERAERVLVARARVLEAARLRGLGHRATTG